MPKQDQTQDVFVTTSVRMRRDEQTEFLTALRAADPRDDMSKAFRRYMRIVIDEHKARHASDGRAA